LLFGESIHSHQLSGEFNTEHFTYSLLHQFSGKLSVSRNGCKQGPRFLRDQE
jgi:hypothetical protein